MKPYCQGRATAVFRYAVHLDQEIGKYFRFGFITNNNYSISMGNNLGLYGNISTSPIADPYNEDGYF